MTKEELQEKLKMLDKEVMMKNKTLNPIAGISSNAEPSNLGTRADGVVKKNSSIQHFAQIEKCMSSDKKINTPVLNKMITDLISLSATRPLTLMEKIQLKEFELIKETLKEYEQQ
jgi:hypothetical protein